MKEKLKLKAKDLMVQDYAIIHPKTPVREAARLISEGRVRETGYKPFGIMVVNDRGRLVGMISMTDILYHVRPPFLKYQPDGTLSCGTGFWAGEIDFQLEEFKDLRVEEIMTSPVVTVCPEDHLMVLIDKMVKHKVRRLPVEDGEKLYGIVYLSDVYYHAYETWLRPKKD
jgi:CBS domain-containing protein